MKIKLTHMLQAHCLWQQDTKHFIFRVIYLVFLLVLFYFREDVLRSIEIFCTFFREYTSLSILVISQSYWSVNYTFLEYIFLFLFIYFFYLHFFYLYLFI